PPAPTKEEVLLTEIRDLLKEQNRSSYSGRDQPLEPFQQHARQQFRFGQQGVLPSAEDAGQVVGGLAVDGQAERRNALQGCFGDRLTHVFHAVAALVVILVVRLAIGEQLLKSMRGGLLQ